MKKIKILDYLLVLLILSLSSLTYFGYVQSSTGNPAGSLQTAFIEPALVSPNIQTPLTGPYQVRVYAPGFYSGEYRIYSPQTLQIFDPSSGTVNSVHYASPPSNSEYAVFNLKDSRLIPDGGYRLFVKLNYMYTAVTSREMYFDILVRNNTVAVSPTTTVSTYPTAGQPTQTTTTAPSTISENSATTTTTKPADTSSATTGGNITTGDSTVDKSNEEILKDISQASEADQVVMLENLKNLPEDLKKAPVTTELKVEKHEIKMLDDTKGKVKFSGKAKPNSKIYLYIFSDPIVVSVNTDSQGNWTYEMDQTISTGRHEVYVALKDSQGKIVEKSKPLTFFVGKAQAAATSENLPGDKYTGNNNLLYYVIFAVALITLVVAGIFYLVTKRHIRKHASS